MTWLTVTEYLCHKRPRICSTSSSFPHSWLITRFVTRGTRWVPLIEQELLTFPEHLRSPLVLVVLVLLSLFCVVFCRPLCCLSFFDLRILITPLLSSHSSCNIVYHNICKHMHWRKKHPWMNFLMTSIWSWRDRGYIKYTWLPFLIQIYYKQKIEKSERVSEFLFNANSVIFQLYQGQIKLIFNEMMRRSSQLDFL